MVGWVTAYQTFKAEGHEFKPPVPHLADVRLGHCNLYGHDNNVNHLLFFCKLHMIWMESYDSFHNTYNESASYIYSA